MSASRKFQFYDPRLARMKNLQGNLKQNFEQQDSLTMEQNRFKTNKKMYMRKKGEIEQHKIFGNGEIFTPNVSDLILNISDIPGTQTDKNYQSDALRHRLAARMMRQNRMKSLQEQKLSMDSIKNTEEAIIEQKPKKTNYHEIAANKNNRIERQQKDPQIESYLYKQSHTQPYEKQQRVQRQVRKNLPMIEIGRNRFQSRRLNESQRRILELERIQTDQPQNFKKRQFSTLQIVQPHHKIQAGLHPNPEFNIFNIRNKSQQNKRSNNQKRQSELNISKQFSIDSTIKQNPSSRINPTFLSYGSKFLTQNKNYLASYGKSLIQ